MPAGQVAAAVQRGRQRQLEPVAFGLGDLALPDSQRLPVQPRGLLEREVLRGHVARRLARPRRADVVAGQRARHPVVGEFGQVRSQLPS